MSVNASILLWFTLRGEKLGIRRSAQTGAFFEPETWVLQETEEEYFDIVRVFEKYVCFPEGSAPAEKVGKSIRIHNY